MSDQLDREIAAYAKTVRSARLPLYALVAWIVLVMYMCPHAEIGSMLVICGLLGIWVGVEWYNQIKREHRIKDGTFPDTEDDARRFLRGRYPALRRSTSDEMKKALAHLEREERNQEKENNG